VMMEFKSIGEINEDELYDKIYQFKGKVRLDSKDNGKAKIYEGRMIKRVEECDNLKAAWKASEEMEKHKKKKKDCKIL